MYKKLMILISILAILFAGCSDGTEMIMKPTAAKDVQASSNAPQVNTAPAVIKNDQYEGVILTEPALSTWTPDQPIIEEFENGLVANLKDSIRSVHQQDDLRFILKNIKEYKRQYIGKKDDVLFCNFLYARNEESEILKDWKTRFIQVKDGGPSFFTVHYDIKTKKYINISINGHA